MARLYDLLRSANDTFSTRGTCALVCELSRVPMNLPIEPHEQQRSFYAFIEDLIDRFPQHFAEHEPLNVPRDRPIRLAWMDVTSPAGVSEILAYQGLCYPDLRVEWSVVSPTAQHR